MQTPIQELIEHFDKFLEEMPIGYTDFSKGFRDAVVQAKTKATGLLEKENRIYTVNDCLVESCIKRIKNLEKALRTAEVIINNGANMCESSVLKNAMLLSLSSLNLKELLPKKT